MFPVCFLSCIMTVILILQENVQWTSSSVLPVVSVSNSVQSVIVVATVLMAAMNKTVPVISHFTPSILSTIITIDGRS